MSRFLETIRIEEGIPALVEYHQERMDQTRFSVLHLRTPLSLIKHIHVPGNCRHGVFKCRIIYDSHIRKIEYLPYRKREIKTLVAVHANRLSYDFKYEDRSDLNVYASRLQAGSEILFIRDNLITDTRYTNVAFFNGRNWFTPAKPLLKGTRLSCLLDQGILSPMDLPATPGNTLHKFTHIRLFNAMIPWEESITLSTNQIRWNNLFIKK